jgi:aryl-alcohol dehydrogenase-like predicted oxidoreductase
VWERVQLIVRDLKISVEELPALALRFCLSHPAVSTVIPGMRNMRHVASNTAVSETGPLPLETLQKLRRHRWVRSFYWT